MARRDEATQQTPVDFAGGLNLVSPTFQLNPGEARVLHNYAVNSLGRYERVKGYLRFDGHRDPLSFPFTVLKMSESQLVHDLPYHVGDTLTGATSGATGVLLIVNKEEVVLVNVTGEFARGEAVSQCTGTVQYIGDSASLGHVSRTQLYRREAAEFHATTILPVPGSGPIRGLAVFHNEVLAWRDNAKGDETILWRSSIGGWTKVNVVPPQDYFPPYPYQYLIYSGQAGQLRYDIDATDPTTHRELESFRRGYFSRAGTFGNLLLPSDDQAKGRVGDIYYYHPTHDTTRIVFDPGIRRGDFGELEIYVEDTPMYRFRDAIQNPNYKPGDTTQPKTIPQAGVHVKHPADTTRIEITIDERIELWTARQRVGFFLFTKDQLPDDPNHRRQWAVEAPSHCAENQKLTIRLHATHDGTDTQGATVTWKLVGLGHPTDHLKAGAINGTSTTDAAGRITLEWEFTPDGHADHETLEWEGVTDYGVELHAFIILDDVQLPAQSHLYVITGPHRQHADKSQLYTVTVKNTEGELVSHQRVEWELQGLDPGHSKKVTSGHFITDKNGQGQIEVSLTKDAPLETFQIHLTSPITNKRFAVQVDPIPPILPPPPEVPDKPPGDFTADAVSSTSVVLTWLDDSADPAATGFSLYRERTGAPGVWALLGEFPSSILTFRDLRCSANTHYRYKLEAYNVNGATTPVYAETTTKAAVPDFAPTEFVAQAYATDGVALQWKDNCTNEDNYELQRSDDNQHFVRIGGGLLPAGTTSYDDTGLTAGTKYYYRVRAVNADGIRLNKNTAWDTTTATTDHVVVSARPPAPPINVVLSTLNYDKLTLRWQANPDTTLGGAPDTYYVERRLRGALDWGFVSELDALKRSYVLTGLQEATEYEVRICAKNRYGHSLYVSALNSTAALPGEPKPASPLKVRLSDPTVSTLTLHWQDNKAGGLPKTYSIDIRKDSEVAWTPFVRVDHTKEEEMTFVFTGLQAGTLYRARIKAENDAGESAPSETVPSMSTAAAPPVPPPPPPVPGQPQNFRVVNTATAQMLLGWSGGSGICTQFELQWLSSGGSWSRSTKLAPDVLSFTVSQLRPGTSYSFRLRANNTAGASPWAMTTGRTDSRPYTPPTRPPPSGGGVSSSGTSYRYQASHRVRFARSDEHADHELPHGQDDLIYGWNTYTKTGGSRYGSPATPIQGSGINIDGCGGVLDDQGGGINIVVSRPSGVHSSARQKFETALLKITLRVGHRTFSWERNPAECDFLDNSTTRHTYIKMSFDKANELLQAMQRAGEGTISVRLS